MAKSVQRVLEGGFEGNETPQLPAEIDPLALPEERKKVYVSFLEGATGVGKSYAYLIPAIEWAVKYKKRVVIATAQKTLQGQIFEKDLPTLLAKLGHVSYALLKGKSNYACHYRIREAENEGENHVHLPMYQPFREWLNKHPTGDLEAFPGDITFLNQVNVEECVWEKCDQMHKCGYLGVKTKAANAQIVVVNHALLAIDLQFGGGKLIGPYDALIIDEAHKAPKFFRDAYSLKLTLGVNNRIERLLDRMGVSQPPEYQKFRETISELFTDLSTTNPGDFQPSPEQISLIQSAASHAQELRRVLGVTLPAAPGEEIPEEAVAEEVPEEDPNEGRGGLKYAMAKKSLGDLFAKLEDTFNVLLCPVTEQTEYLVALEEERSSMRSWLALKAMPIEVGPLVSPALRNIGKVVVTSATISAGGEFGFMATEFGFTTKQLVEATQFHSSFDYKGRSALYIPPDAVEYDYNNRDNYYKANAAEIMGLVKASFGGAFVLCASRQDLDAFYNALKPQCDAAGLVLMTQGRSIEQDVAAFKRTPGAVLMGLHSLWEGVDVPGLALRLVIIPRIPFPNKSDNLLQARKRLAAERMVEMGMKESEANFRQFTAFDVQIAAIHLAQGAGRLIRSEADLGVVAVLDKRLYGSTKNYSAFLRRSLPHPLITDRNAVLGFLAKLGAKAKNTG
jgi:ATP-dependent DNA helicase DinG